MRRSIGYFLCLFSFPVFAQVSDYYPEHFAAFFYTYNLNNPAYLPEQGKLEFNAGYSNRTGPFRKIANFYLTGERIKRDKDKSARTLRVIVQNEKEGPYILRPKAFFNYAYQLPLKRNSFLAAGISAGVASIRFSAPSATGTGTAYLPDGALGLTYRSPHVFAGFSVMQMFNAVTEPVNGAIRLGRYYNSFLSLQNDISPFWKIHGDLLMRIQPGYRHELNAAIRFSHNDALSFGSIVRLKRGLSFFGGLQFPVGEELVFFSFTYNTAAFSTLPEFQNSMDVTLRLALD